VLLLCRFCRTALAAANRYDSKATIDGLMFTTTR